MTITPDDIAKARSTIAAACKGPATWTANPGETEEAALERFRKAYDGARAITGSTTLHAVEVERQHDGTCLVMAITGNGPLAGANAAYIVGSFDPVAGWAAALDEVERLRRELAAATKDEQEAHDDFASEQAAKDRLESEVERLTKLQGETHALNERMCLVVERADAEVARLSTEVERQQNLHALAERAMHSANEASKGFAAQAQRYFDAKEPLEVVADAARALVAAHDASDEPSPVTEEVRDLKRALDGAPVPPEVAKLQAEIEGEP